MSHGDAHLGRSTRRRHRVRFAQREDLASRRRFAAILGGSVYLCVVMTTRAHRQLASDQQAQSRVAGMLSDGG